MPGFFLNTNKKTKKRKHTGGKKNGANINKRKGGGQEIESDDESIVSGDEKVIEDDESQSDEETAVEKRLRLAKDYINQLEDEHNEKEVDRDFDKDAIAHRLEEDALEDAGRLEKFIANSILPDHDNIRVLKGHRLSITSVVISSDSKYIFSGSKDGSIIKWNVSSGDKLARIDGKSKKNKKKCKGHEGQVLSLALSTDFMYLASAGHDKVIHIWNPDTLTWLHTFKGHRNIISGLAFQLKQHQLFSASNDRAIKVWNLDQMAYVETLFGHEDAVLGVDSLFRNRVVTCGGRDRSVRLWKIPEESQLVFQSSMGSSFDCVTMLNEDYFLTGGDDGSLSIFFTRKKKPITLRTNAHTKNEDGPSEAWITAVTSLPYTDIVASGSCDGSIKLWRCEKAFRSILPIHEIKVPGYINSLKFSSDCEFLVAGVGQEHRLGRWWKVKEAKNAIYIIPLKKIDTSS